MSIKFKSILQRFLKGLITAGLSTAVASVKDLGVAGLTDPRVVLGAAAIGFTTGVLLAAEKFLSWEDQPTP